MRRLLLAAAFAVALAQPAAARAPHAWILTWLSAPLIGALPPLALLGLDALRPRPAPDFIYFQF
ncbi:MAG: hypothetical protein KC549_10400 [Myxococcales bacterium]|nr:hypothetical protein [Myxococcales bacterium]